jgi:E3 ubiquitin-protein ligase TRIP12
LIIEDSQSNNDTALSEVLKADHGFNVESRAIRDLIEVMANFDAHTRREYLQFITGSPKLPIGGEH